MRKSIIVFMILAMLVVFPLLAFGKSSKSFDSYLHKGDFAVLAGVGLGYYGSITVYPGVEYLVYETKIADFLPLEFGVSGRGFLNFYSHSDTWGTYGWTAFGAGGFGTVHWGLKGANIDVPNFLKKIDIYWGIGLTYSSFKYTGDWASLSPYVNSGGAIGIATYGGFNYFINNHLAVFLEGNYWSYGGGTLGIYYKL